MAFSKKILKTYGVVFFWIAVWYISVSIVNRSLLIAIPGPMETIQALFKLKSEPEFWKSIFYSVWRIVKGYLIAVVIGSVCASCSVKSSFFRALTSPIVHIIRAVPVASFIILVFLWLDKNIVPTFISFLMVFPIVWSNVENGILQVDKKLIEMARIMGLSGGRILKEITLPSIMPSLSTALISGLGFAWKSGVAAEVISRTELSIGNMLWSSKNAIDYDEVFALTLIIIILSFLLENVLKIFLKRWQK